MAHDLEVEYQYVCSAYSLQQTNRIVAAVSPQLISYDGTTPRLPDHDPLHYAGVPVPQRIPGYTRSSGTIAGVAYVDSARYRPERKC